MRRPRKCGRGSPSGCTKRWSRSRKTPPCAVRNEALLFRLIRSAFGQRRKMIRNSLKSVFGDFGGAEHPFFTRRAEQLSVADFVELTNWVAAHRQ